MIEVKRNQRRSDDAGLCVDSQSLSIERQLVTTIQTGVLKSQFKPLCKAVFGTSVEAAPTHDHHGL